MNQNANFQKPDITERQQRQRNRDNFTNPIYQNICRKKTSRFWEPTKPTTNTAEAAKQSQSKPPQTETQTKNLEADFRDSTNPTWIYANKENTAKRKSRELENLLAEKYKPEKWLFEKCCRQNGSYIFMNWKPPC